MRRLLRSLPALLGFRPVRRRRWCYLSDLLCPHHAEGNGALFPHRTEKARFYCWYCGATVAGPPGVEVVLSAADRLRGGYGG